MKRRRWFEIHSWIGVVTGLVMFLICWSGTVAVLANEIDWLLDSRVRAASDARPLSWSMLEASVRRTYPDATSLTLEAPLAPGFAARALIDRPAQSYVWVYLDPATGGVRGHSSYFNVQRFFRSLHMSLFDFGTGRTYGYWFVGVFAVLLLVSTLTPLVFYRRWWRGFFTLKRGRGLRVFLSDAHKLIGVWSLLFAALMAVTGIWYLSEWFGADFDYPERAPIERPAAGARQSLDELVAAARRAWPALDVRAVTVPEGSYWGPVLYVEGQTDVWLVRDRANFLMLDPSDGSVLRRQNVAEVGWPARWVDTVDPLHFGNFGGLAVKVVWFVFGLLLSALALTGAYLHAQRLTQAQPRAGWRGMRSAILLTGLVLVATAYGAVVEFRRFGPVVAGAPTGPDVPIGVMTFLVGWIALTLVIVVVWAYVLWRRGAGPRYEVAGSSASTAAQVVLRDT
jgi:uncharacterized iron-regulated membrane protein